MWFIDCSIKLCGFTRHCSHACGLYLISGRHVKCGLGTTLAIMHRQFNRILVCILSTCSVGVCPAFYVAYDHQEEAVVVAIRGSMTVQVQWSQHTYHIPVHCFSYRLYTS